MSFKKQQSFMKQQTFYAVGVGRQRGIYLTWPECEKQVKGINNAKFRKFNTRTEAEKFVEDHASPIAKGFSPSPYKPNTPPVTPTSQQSYTQPRPSTTSNVMEKSRKMMSTWSSQSQVDTRTAEAVIPNKRTKIEEESTNSSDDECLNLMDALTQEFASQSNSQSSSTMTTKGKGCENEALKQQLDALKHRLETIEESVHDVFGHATMEIKNIKQEMSKIENKLKETHEPSLNNTVQRLKERTTQREAENPTKQTRLLESDDSGAGSSQEAGSSQINFSFDPEGFCIVYTDGSCTNNGRNGAKAGIGVYFGPNHPLNVGDPLRNCLPTNNNAEIQAASYAINIAKVSGISKLCVHTDSEFLINCVNKWMAGWKRRGWRKADNKPVINREQLEILDAAMQNVEVKWVHVRGHSNVPGNEMADQLANEGAAKYTDSS